MSRLSRWAPLGLGNNATSPWLPGSAIDPVVLLAWVLLLGAPLAAGGVAGWAHRGPNRPTQLGRAGAWQGVAAGFLATGLGALIVTVLGTGTIALMPRAGWLLRCLYPGQHLLAAAAYHRELTASANAAGYGLILLIFPIIGLFLGLTGCSWAHIIRSQQEAATRSAPVSSSKRSGVAFCSVRGKPTPILQLFVAGGPVTGSP